MKRKPEPTPSRAAPVTGLPHEFHPPPNAHGGSPEVRTDGFTLRDEANAIVAVAFRNGPIEDLHAGRYSLLLKDATLSRITDAEMKTIMVAACRTVEELLRLRESDPREYARRIRDSNERYCRGWER